MKTWFVRHLQTLIGSLGRLSQHSLGNLLTVLAIGIALALPACIYVLLGNARIATAGWNDSVNISVYLKGTMSTAEVDQVADRLRKRQDIGDLRVVKAEEG